MRAAGRRLSWGIADQVFSSLTNFLLTIFVARVSTVREFGVFALIFTTYNLAAAAARALGGEPLGVRFAECSPETWRRGAGDASGAAIWVGTAVGLVCVLVALLLDGGTRTTLLAFGATMPLLLLQDIWRYAFFAEGRGWKALLNDLLWFVVMISALVFVVVAGFHSVTIVVLAWSGSAGVAAAFGCWQAGTLPRLDRAAAWFREQRDLIGGFFGDFVIRAGMTRISIYAVAVLAGLQATGALRGASLLLGPVTLVFMGLTPLAVPEAVRLINRASPHLMRAMVLLSTVLAGAAVVVGLSLLALPDSIGRLLLHDTWEPARHLILISTAVLATSSANTGALVGLRALGESKRLVRGRAFAGPLIATCAIGGAAIDGAFGSAAGNALATLITDILWWRLLAAAIRGWRASNRSTPAQPESGLPAQTAETPTL